MSGLDRLLGPLREAGPDPRALAFLRWQSRVRQIAMRQHGGRPGPGATPDLFLPGEDEPLGAVVTVLNKRPEHSRTPELRHLARRTQDPAERRAKALELFSETYFQKAETFSDTLTASFAPGSAGAARIAEAGACRLRFEAYAQAWDLACAAEALAEGDPLREATLAHNALFNPGRPAGAVVLGFRPDWEASRAEPPL